MTTTDQFSRHDAVVTVRDAETLLGPVIPKGMKGRVIRSGPPIVGPYSVYVQFENYVSRQVLPEDLAHQSEVTA
jgi:hypothetical protein